MRGTTFRRAGLLGALLAALLAPGVLRAQPENPAGQAPFSWQDAPAVPGVVRAQSGAGTAVGYAPGEFQLWAPTGNNRPEDSGFFFGGEFLLFRQTNPLKEQGVASRGFFDINRQTPNGAAFLGSGTPALDVNQVTGPGSYQPGFRLMLGWKFPDQSILTFNWMYLTEIRYTAVATAVPKNFKLGLDFADSFLTSPVYNFPNNYAGLQEAGPNGVQTYGIWDGASIMTEQFLQRTQQYDFTYRKPFYENEDYRLSALVGPRFFWIWERYKWRTTNFGFTGSEGPSADYSNIDSNRMYGVFIGCSQECYLGGGFAAQLDTEGTLYLDIVKERAKYELEPKFTPPQSKRARTEYAVVPEVSARLSLMWYPIESVQVQVGYNFLAFFNTVVSQRPIDFNYSSVTPEYNHVFRLFDGVSASIVFTF